MIIDRVKADQYGVDIELIGNSIQMLTHGLKVTEYMPEDSDEEIDIVIKYERKYRTLDELDKILVEGKNGPVSLSLFVDRKPISKIGKITRNNSTRSKNIKFDVKEGEIFCTKDDLVNCSGLALGSPTRFGSMAAPMKYFLDSTGDLWSNNELENKFGCVFTSTGSQHGGQEITLFNLMTYLLHQGMVFVALLIPLNLSIPP